MLDNINQSATLPDIASEEKAKIGGTLQWVGMSDIELPVKFNADIELPPTTASVRAEVSLDNEDIRGIHMSRIYLACDKVFSNQTIDYCVLNNLTQQFIDSHREISRNALVEVETQALVRRPALVSGYTGWRSYPIKLSLIQSASEGTVKYLSLNVTYSSTCPCSAALARQLIQKNFSESFQDQSISHEKVLEWLGSENGINATPHSQRSSAIVKIRLAQETDAIPINSVIEVIENTLQTSVQAAVKREDEQAFALRNGQNLMFCEDAARRIKDALNQCRWIKQFHLRVTHYESLHPHNATAETYNDKEKDY